MSVRWELNCILPVRLNQDVYFLVNLATSRRDLVGSVLAY